MVLELSDVEKIARRLRLYDVFEPHMGSGRPRPAASSLTRLLDKRIGRSKRFGAGKAAPGGRADFVSYASDPRQRAVVKVHYFTHSGGGSAAMGAHGRYIARDGAERGDMGLDPDHDQREPEIEHDRNERHARYLSREFELGFYDRTENGVDGAARMAEWSRSDTRHFRVILSAENGGQIRDLHGYTREVMDRAEERLARGPLQWVAVDHWDTDNPHSHIVLRGCLANGRPLGLPRDFVRHQFREIARDVASERLGPRGPDEERLARDREVRMHAPTRLDRFISDRLDLNRDVRLADLGKGISDPDLARSVRSRADELMRLGLAERTGPGQARFVPDWQGRLREMEMHLDQRRRVVRERQYERDLGRAGDKLSRETGKPFQKAPEQERGWRVRGSISIGGKEHVMLERSDAVTLMKRPRELELKLNQQVELDRGRSILKLARGLGIDR